MGKGLSPLQKAILESARARHPEPVYYAQMLVELAGWKPVTAPDLKSGQYERGQNFDRKSIGEKEYQTVRASLSRACRRLEERGLISIERGICKWGRILLKK